MKSFDRGAFPPYPCQAVLPDPIEPVTITLMPSSFAHAGGRPEGTCLKVPAPWARLGRSSQLHGFPGALL